MTQIYIDYTQALQAAKDEILRGNVVKPKYIKGGWVLVTLEEYSKLAEKKYER